MGKIQPCIILYCFFGDKKSFQKLVLRVSSGFQMLENNKTTRPAASWFQMFSRLWKPDETLALIEIVLKHDCSSEVKDFHCNDNRCFID